MPITCPPSIYPLTCNPIKFWHIIKWKKIKILKCQILLTKGRIYGHKRTSDLNFLCHGHYPKIMSSRTCSIQNYSLDYNGLFRPDLGSTPICSNRPNMYTDWVGSGWINFGHNQFSPKNKIDSIQFQVSMIIRFYSKLSLMNTRAQFQGSLAFSFIFGS